MVKKNKIHRLCAALFAVALLFVSLAPVLSIGANAMVIQAERDEETYDFTIPPDIMYWTIPLDIMYSKTCGIVVENPMLSVAIDNGFTHITNIEMPGISATSTLPETFMERWHFEVNDYELSSETSYQKVQFGLQIDSGATMNEFGFTNSESFVCSFGDVFNFLNEFSLLCQPGYEFHSTVSVNLFMPKKIDGKWELVEYALDYEGARLNLHDDPRWYNPFPCGSLIDDVEYDPNYPEIIVENINISIKYFNLEDGELDHSAPASMLDFDVPMGRKLIRCSFAEFYEKYNGSYPVYASTGSFDLTSGLKAAIGGFLSTQIIPGLSFGGILAAVVGIMLFGLLLKIFNK